MREYKDEEIAKMLEDIPHSEIPMIVVTNIDRINGAAVMFYPDVMDRVFEKASRYEDRKHFVVKQFIRLEDKTMNKAKNVERITAHVKKVNTMVEKK